MPSSHRCRTVNDSKESKPLIEESVSQHAGKIMLNRWVPRCLPEDCRSRIRPDTDQKHMQWELVLRFLRDCYLPIEVRWLTAEPRVLLVPCSAFATCILAWQPSSQPCSLFGRGGPSTAQLHQNSGCASMCHEEQLLQQLRARGGIPTSRALSSARVGLGGPSLWWTFRPGSVQQKC